MPSITLEYPKEPYSTHELETIHQIINSSPILHVSFNTDSSPFPMILPMIGFMGSYDRPSADIGDVLDLYLHGYVSHRLLRLSRGTKKPKGDSAADSTSTTSGSEERPPGLPVSVAASHVDGFVLTSTPNGHVYNYRSAVVFGYASVVEDNEEKLWAMENTTNSVVPDRWNNVVLPLAKSELASVGVLRVKVKTGSAKIRTGPPSAGTGDADMSVWKGVLPIYQTVGEPVPTPDRKNMDVPTHITEFREGCNVASRNYAIEAAVKPMVNKSEES
ncbi:hypothetical protein VMCG_10716 [Cytospora schulzeri]|uniref:Flavin-nucleotide-binding protein n=1 Tax=Cytospora schulzeri TaxID=448051 RepID=A0A423V994_9PEZI|nr:hypothetical protein VMCG_10716 [Valsa malicola]